jgi:hypothetical protein
MKQGAGAAMMRGSTLVWVLVLLGGIALAAAGYRSLDPSRGDQPARAGATNAAPRFEYHRTADGSLFQPDAASTRIPGEDGLVPFPHAAGTRHAIRVSKEAAQRAVVTGRLPIVLPGGPGYDVVFDRQESATNGDWTFIGKVDTRLGRQSAVLTFGPEGVFGVLPRPDGTLLQITTSHGVTVLEPMRPIHPPSSPSAAPPVNDVVLPQSASQMIATAGRRAPGKANRARHGPDDRPATGNPTMAVASDAGTIDVDVLAFYSTNMVTLRGSAAAVETECNNYLAIANQAHLDSGSRVRLHFVGLREINYPATNFNSKALSDLSANTLPDGTDAVALRDSLSADLVAMFRPYVNGDTNGGIANLGVASNDSAAFSVSNLGSFTFAHETGHNLGSMHDIETSTDSSGLVQYGAYPYSFGFRQDGPPAFATIMAYPANSQVQIGYFSHPGPTDCMGVACGIADRVDNSRSLDEFAPAVARYRFTPNTLVIDDATMFEGDPVLQPYNGVHTLKFNVRLSTPAPVGGVHFDISTRDGTALASSDYEAKSETAVVIPEGQASYAFEVAINSDTVVEPDEAFFVEVSNVAGMAVLDPIAEGHILNEDPRAIISGRLLVPEGFAAPSYAVTIGVSMMDHGQYRPVYMSAEPPGFEYQIPVVRGSDVSIEIRHPEGSPFADASYELGIVDGNQARDFPLVPEVKVSGRLKVPAAGPPLTQPVNVIAYGYQGDSWGVVLTASPPDFEFSTEVMQGATVRLVTSGVPAPYVEQEVNLGAVTSDRRQDIELQSVPALNIPDVSLSEGRQGESKWANFAVVLSAPAPAGGVRVDVATANGSAVAGMDFLSVARTVTIGAGSSSTTVSVPLIGDDVAERNETFTLVASNVTGAWGARETATATILNDDTGPAIADLNGDGASDLLWRNAGLGQLDWWLMDGLSRTGAGTQAANGKYRVAAQGDFNGDGLTDLVWEDAARQELQMWLAIPAGGFMSVSMGAYPQGGYVLVGAGDVDGDQRDDLLWHNPGAGLMDWWLMDGATRRSAASQAIPSVYRVEGIGDLDGDGRADVLWADTAGTELWVWSARATGGFAAEYIGVHPASNWKMVGVGDVDADGRGDLLWHDATAGRFDWWTMHGAARTGTGSQAIPPGYDVIGIADLDADGRQDILWSETSRTTLWAWLAIPAGGFTPQPMGDHPPAGWEMVYPRPDYDFGRPGDIDGDGKSDVAWHSVSSQQFDVWHMDGAARSSVGSTFIPAQYEVAARADFNGDGREDVMWRDAAHTALWLWLSQAGGAFGVEFVANYPPPGWELVAAGDVDADGRADLVWHNGGLQEMDWWLMHGAKRVGVGSRAIPGRYHVAAAADFNGDGRLDLLWRDSLGSELWAWLGDPQGFEVEWLGMPPASSWGLVATGDVDGDGRDDIVWHNPQAQEVDWWLMDGARRLGVGRKYVGDSYRVVDIGDYDGDGRADLLWRDTGRTSLWMWSGTGSDFRVDYVGAHPQGDWSVIGRVWQ